MFRLPWLLRLRRRHEAWNYNSLSLVTVLQWYIAWPWRCRAWITRPIVEKNALCCSASRPIARLLQKNSRRKIAFLILVIFAVSVLDILCDVKWASKMGFECALQIYIATNQHTFCLHSVRAYTLCLKKRATLLTIISPNLNQFSNFFQWKIC